MTVLTSHPALLAVFERMFDPGIVDQGRSVAHRCPIAPDVSVPGIKGYVPFVGLAVGLLALQSLMAYPWLTDEAFKWRFWLPLFNMIEMH
jgi:hypothetical protein